MSARRPLELLLKNRLQDIRGHLVDAAQYNARRAVYDYGIAPYHFLLGL